MPKSRNKMTMSTVMYLTAHIYCSGVLFFNDFDKIDYLLNLFEDAKSSLETALKDYEKEEENERKLIYEQKLIISGDENDKLKKDTMQLLDSAGFFKNNIFEVEPRNCYYKEVLVYYLRYSYAFEIFFALIKLKSNARNRYQLFTSKMVEFNILFSRENLASMRQRILETWNGKVFVAIVTDKVCVEARISSSKLVGEKFIKFKTIFFEISNQYRDLQMITELNKFFLFR